MTQPQRWNARGCCGIAEILAVHGKPHEMVTARLYLEGKIPVVELP